MLNAAAEINRKRMDARIKQRRENGESTLQEDIAELPMINGKRLDELTSDEYLNYMGREGPRPKVIKIKKEPDES